MRLRFWVALIACQKHGQNHVDTFLHASGTTHDEKSFSEAISLCSLRPCWKFRHAHKFQLHWYITSTLLLNRKRSYRPWALIRTINPRAKSATHLTRTTPTRPSTPIQQRHLPATKLQKQRRRSLYLRLKSVVSNSSCIGIHCMNVASYGSPTSLQLLWKSLQRKQD